MSMSLLSDLFRCTDAWLRGVWDSPDAVSSAADNRNRLTGVKVDQINGHRALFVHPWYGAPMLWTSLFFASAGVQGIFPGVTLIPGFAFGRGARTPKEDFRLLAAHVSTLLRPSHGEPHWRCFQLPNLRQWQEDNRSAPIVEIKRDCLLFNTSGEASGFVLVPATVPWRSLESELRSQVDDELSHCWIWHCCERDESGAWQVTKSSLECARRLYPHPEAAMRAARRDCRRYDRLDPGPTFMASFGAASSWSGFF